MTSSSKIQAETVLLYQSVGGNISDSVLKNIETPPERSTAKQPGGDELVLSTIVDPLHGGHRRGAIC